jgi:hypothetical protein
MGVPKLQKENTLELSSDKAAYEKLNRYNFLFHFLL